MILGRLVSTFHPARRRLERQQFRLERARARAALANIQGEIAFREKENPREMAALRQSMFGRGLGRSTIASQEQERLAGIHARRMAALLESQAIAERGLRLLRRRRRFQRIMEPFSYLDALAQAGLVVGGAVTGNPWMALAGGLAGNPYAGYTNPPQGAQGG